MRYIVCLFCLLFAAGCGTKSTLEGTGPAPFTNEWKTTLAIIKAADASGNYGVAMKAAEQELELRPENAEARLILARLQTLEGRPRLALETLAPLPAGNEVTEPGAAPPARRAVEPGVPLEQGRAYLALDDSATARGYLEQCLAAEPGALVRREARKLLAVSFDKEGDHEKAQAIYAELLTERDEVSVRYNYGRSLLAVKEYGKSASMLMPLVDMAQLPQARLAAAAALANNGERKGARNLLQGYMPDADIERILGEKRQ